MSTRGALTLRGVTKRYPGADRPAVDGVTLEVRAGELLALVGASGSGKTTTLRIAAGYERPDAGDVLLTDGGAEAQPITHVPPERRGFGMVFQHYALFPHMTVEENVAFGLEARGVRKPARLTQARAALATVGLDGKGGRAVQALSGGEQQRVALARALVIEPPVLLLDEPLSNLDPSLRESTRNELRAMLRRLGVTAMFVTHDQEDAFAIADRVAMLRAGALVQVGTPEALYHAPASRHVAEFIGRATLLPAQPTAHGSARIVVAGVGQEVTVSAGAAAGVDWLAVVRPEAVTIGSPADGGWPGEVVHRRFAGTHHSYGVRLADGTILDAAADGGEWQEGAAVGVVPRRGGRPIPLVRA